MFLPVFNSILVLCIIIAAGYILQKKGIVTNSGTSTLSGILINLTLPILMIVSMQKEFDIDLFKNSIMILFISFAIHMFGLLVGTILCKVLKAPLDEEGVWTFTLVFPNLTYMGLPVIESIYGSDAIFYVSMCTVVFNILSFSLGIKIITKGKDKSTKLNWKDLAFNMPILGTIIGFILFVFSFKLPDTILRSFTLIGNMTVPLSMIVIGALLAKIDIKTVFSDWKTYIVILFRQIIIPVCVYLVLSSFIKDKVILGTLVILFGMPAASITAILAAQYGQNSISASKMVFLSTITSIITIPIITLLF